VAQTITQPWGMTLMTERLPVSGPDHCRVELDPDTQQAVYYGPDGQIIPSAKHGTNKTLATTSWTSGGDGQNPQPQVSDDSTTDYESD
jgi:putative ATP-grasp target RiPP